MKYIKLTVLAGIFVGISSPVFALPNITLFGNRGAPSQGEVILLQNPIIPPVIGGRCAGRGRPGHKRHCEYPGRTSGEYRLTRYE